MPTSFKDQHSRTLGGFNIRLALVKCSGDDRYHWRELRRTDMDYRLSDRQTVSSGRSGDLEAVTGEPGRLPSPAVRVDHEGFVVDQALQPFRG